MSLRAVVVAFFSIGIVLVALEIAAAERPVVVLRTEFASFEEIEGTVAGRLLRELGRQAVLIAARDELGAVTRDETLGETEHLGEIKATVDWLPRVRTRWKGPTEVRLEQAANSTAVGDPITASDEKVGVTSVYPVLAAAWEEASRTNLKDRLKEAGVKGQIPRLNAENQPDAKVETLLKRMNFVSQWEAVSRAHRAIAKKGPSVEWLSVLARGYAHLGMLTDHHWNGSPEAFYARAMLYAERARTLGADDAAAAWLRPYVLAMCGAHAAAINEARELGDDVSQLPAWVQVIDPVSRFDLEGLEQLAKTDPTLRSIALWSRYCLARTLGPHSSFQKVAMASLESDPDAYGAYRGLVNVYYSLGDQRYGATVGPATLGKRPLQRIAEVEDLPKPFREALPTNTAELRKLVGKLKDSYAEDPFLPTPNFLIDELRKADNAAPPREPSWESLAALIAEEQFIAAVSYCSALNNATESDLKEPFDAIAQLVEGHRYAPFIKACGLPRTASAEQLDGLIGGLAVRDARHNMRPLILKGIPLQADPGQRNFGYDISWRAMWSYDYRLPSLAEEYGHGSEIWWNGFKDKDRQWCVTAYRETSPHAPHWLRAEAYQTIKATPEQLEEWAPIAKKDFASARNMGIYYQAAGDTEKAVEWMKLSYELEPDVGTVQQLAALYRTNGQKDLWLPTLKQYLSEVESRGLEHSRVQVYIAETLMREDRDYAAARPYAEAAAETYSAQALAIAMEANEGLARWEEADSYAKALSTSYPSHSGERWYFFRRRTGHGDPEETKPYLEQAFAADQRNTKPWDKASYPYYEGRVEESIDTFHAEGVRSNLPI